MAEMFYSQFAMMLYDLHDHKLRNTARWQEPAFHKASNLTMIHLWSTQISGKKYSDKNSDNLRYKITLQMIWNVLLDYEQRPGIAAL